MLSQADRKRFRTIAHKLKPVVTVSGKGLHENLMSELERALTDHELIKIRIVSERDERAEIVEAILSATGAERVATIGGVAVIYRAASGDQPALSNIRRSGLL